MLNLLQQLRTNYFTMLMGLFAISAYMPSCDNFMEPKIFGGRIGYLHLTYIAIVAFGVCPTAHWVTLHGGLQNEHVAVSVYLFLKIFSVQVSIIAGLASCFSLH